MVKIKQAIREVMTNETYMVRSPEDAAKVAAGFIGDKDRGVFSVMCLNTKNQVVSVHQAHDSIKSYLLRAFYFSPEKRTALVRSSD